MRYSQRLLYMAMLLTLFIAVPGHVRSLRAAPAPARVQDPHHSDQGFAPEAATPDEHQRAMSQNMMRMMNEMKTADAKMDELVQAMNAAKGPEKTDAIAAVVTALVEQHRSMHSSMATMMMMGMMNKMGAPGSTEPARPKP